MASLPAVASNFHTDCKKCGQERYHRVLAHPTPTTAKLECEVCHSKKTYKLDEGNTSVAKAKKPAAPKKKTDRGTLFTRRDTDGDGRLSRAEFLANQPDPAAAPQRFERFDIDKNGFLSRDEFLNMGRTGTP